VRIIACAFAPRQNYFIRLLSKIKRPSENVQSATSPRDSCLSTNDQTCQPAGERATSRGLHAFTEHAVPRACPKRNQAGLLTSLAMTGTPTLEVLFDLRLRRYHSRNTKSMIEITPINIPANAPEDMFCLLFFPARCPMDPCAVEVGEDVVHCIVDVRDERLGNPRSDTTFLRRWR
jgi:hypothetical protein